MGPGSRGHSLHGSVWYGSEDLPHQASIIEEQSAELLPTWFFCWTLAEVPGQVYAKAEGLVLSEARLVDLQTKDLVLNPYQGSSSSPSLTHSLITQPT